MLEKLLKSMFHKSYLHTQHVTCKNSACNFLDIFFKQCFGILYEYFPK